MDKHSPMAMTICKSCDNAIPKSLAERNDWRCFNCADNVGADGREGWIVTCLATLMEEEKEKRQKALGAGA